MKLSELMKKGAESIPAAQGTFFHSDNNGVIGCCALGAAILGANPNFAEWDESANSWIATVEKKIGYSIRTTLIPLADLPDSAKRYWLDWTATKYVIERVPLFDLIATINDKVSREYVIQLVEELGY